MLENIYNISLILLFFKHLSVSGDTEKGPKPHLQISSKSLRVGHIICMKISSIALLSLKVENTQTLVQKHFDKTNITYSSHPNIQYKIQKH